MAERMPRTRVLRKLICFPHLIAACTAAAFAGHAFAAVTVDFETTSGYPTAPTGLTTSTGTQRTDVPNAWTATPITSGIPQIVSTNAIDGAQSLQLPGLTTTALLGLASTSKGNSNNEVLGNTSDVSIQATIALLISTSQLTLQVRGPSGYSQGYVRFDVSGGANHFDYYNGATDTSVALGSSYTAGDQLKINLISSSNSGTYSLAITDQTATGTPTLFSMSGIGFRNGASAVGALTSLAITGDTNAYVDDIFVANVAAPEPVSAGLIPLAAIFVFGRSRRASRSAVGGDHARA